MNTTTTTIELRGCPTCEGPAQAIAEGEGVRYRHVDLRQATNTRGVSEAMYRHAIQAWIDRERTHGHDLPAQLLAALEAALSAEPAAQGEAEYDVGWKIRGVTAYDDAKRKGYRHPECVEAAIKAAPPAQPAERGPSVCDGKEQDAFEAWARSQSYNMTVHPLHWLFLDKKTYAARQGWKGALEYVASLTASPAPSEGGKGVDDDPPTCPICDQMKLSARCSACGYEDDPTTGAAR